MFVQYLCSAFQTPRYICNSSYLQSTHISSRRVPGAVRSEATSLHQLQGGYMSFYICYMRRSVTYDIHGQKLVHYNNGVTSVPVMYQCYYTRCVVHVLNLRSLAAAFLSFGIEADKRIWRIYSYVSEYVAGYDSRWVVIQGAWHCLQIAFGHMWHCELISLAEKYTHYINYNLTILVIFGFQ